MKYVAPILSVPNVPKSLEFYQEALGFKEWFSIKDTQGQVVFGGVVRDDVHLMFGALNSLGPEALPLITQGVRFYVDLGEDDIDALYEEVRDRVQVAEPIADRYWGDRAFTVQDPVGYRIMFSKTVERLSNEELSARAEETQAART